MTEDEAKTKTCPQTFCQPGQYGPHGEGIVEPGPHTCIGSACMAFRWIPPLCYVDSDESAIERDPPFGPWERYRSGGWISSQKQNQGYCGLAGPIKQTGEK